MPDESTNSTIKNASLSFTYIFIIEMGLKIIGNGPIGYIRDPMNILDGLVVLLSIIELIFSSGSHAFSAFRATRVLRVAKLLRTLEFMRFLIAVLSKTFKDFMSVFLLIIIFLYIYALLGMQLLGGKFNYPDNVGWNATRNNYDTFVQAMICAYQVMTVENWNNILFFAERSGAGYFLPVLYLISWIIIGNYILLNLLMAMLLAQFTGEEIEEDQMELDEELEDEKKDEENDETNNKFSVEIPKTHFITLHQKLLGIIVTSQQKIKETKAERQITPASNSLFDDDDDTYNQDNEKKEFIYFENSKCKKSLFIFSQEDKLRRALYWLIKQNWFDYVVLAVIVISSLKLAFDTYIDASDPTMANVNNISSQIDIAMTIFFICEAFFKIISCGFILEQGCYLRDSWNILDFTIVLSGTIDIASQDVNIPFLKVLYPF